MALTSEQKKLAQSAADRHIKNRPAENISVLALDVGRKPVQTPAVQSSTPKPLSIGSQMSDTPTANVFGKTKKVVYETPVVQSRDRNIVSGELNKARADLQSVYEMAQSTTDSVVLTPLKAQAEKLRQSIDTLEGELWTIDQKNMYSAIPGYSDFAQNSVYAGTGSWADDKYAFINNVNGARGTMLARGMQGGGGNYAPYTYMSQDEINTYNYLYNVSGKKAADNYLDYLMYDLNARSQQRVGDVAAFVTGRDTKRAAMASAASVITSLGSGAGYIDVLGQKLAKALTGSNKPIDYNRSAQTGYVTTQAVRDTALGNIKSNAGKFIYSTAMSMADSLGVLGASMIVGPAATLLLGGSAATSTMQKVKANGGTDEQALGMGFVAGAVETLAEKLPLDNLLNMKSAAGLKQVFAQIFRQAGIEATEETITSLTNTAAEALIMGDKSDLNMKYEAYLAELSPEEAKKKATADWLEEIVLDAAGGFVSGLLFGVGGAAKSAASAVRKGKSISTTEQTMNAIIEEVEQGDYSEETKKAAAAIKNDIANGNNVSNLKKGQFADLIEQDNPNFLQDVLPGIMLRVEQQEDAENKENPNASEQVPVTPLDKNANFTGISETQQQTTETGGNDNGETGADLQRAEQTADAETDTVYSDRGRGRFSDAYTGDAGPVNTENLRDAAGARSRAQTADKRQRDVAALRIEPVSAAEIGVSNGTTNAEMYIMPGETYDDELKSIDVDAKKYGLNVKYFTGILRTESGASANAVIIGDRVYVKADSTRYSTAELYDHEKFHNTFRKKAGMIKALAQWIRANYDSKSFDSILEEYYEKYDAVYDFGSMTEEEATALIVEEILADAFAGTNKFGMNASDYTSVSRAIAEETTGVKPAEYNANRGRAPPDGMTYDDVKQAVREVMSEVMSADGNKNTATEGNEARFAVGENREYDTTKLHWAYENGIINKKDGATFWHTIADIQKRNYAIPRSTSGEYIISTDRKLMFTNADYYSPTLTRVIVFGDNDNTSAQKAKELIIGAETGKYDYGEAKRLIGIYYGEQYTAEYRYQDFRTDEGRNRRSQRENGRRDTYEVERGENGDIDTRFALSEEADTDGNYLTVDQQEYFAESKVRDENGNLLVMYHGTPNAGYTIFNPGTYFTQNKAYADVYQGQGASSLGYKKTAINPDTYKVYLNIKKPFDTRNQAEREIFENDYLGKWGMGTPLMDSGLPDWMDGGDLQEFIEEEGYDYDGLILDEGGVGGYGDEVKSRGLSYVVFSPEQVKSVDNKTPTNDPDYRFAISDEIDSEYLDAVESGDIETAQSIVNDIASEAMPQSKIRTEDGNLRVVYHGTNTGDFAVFNPDYIGMSSGDDGFFGMGFYFAYSKGEASYYGAKRIIPAFLNLTNPFDFERELQMYNGEKARSGHAPDAVSLMNFADKFPGIAKNVTIGVARGWGEDVENITLIEFAKAFKEVIGNKTFEYSEVTNEYGEKETIVYADEKMVEYEYGGEKYSYRDYGFQKRFWGEPNRLDVAYEYLSNVVFSYIDLPTRTQVILDNNREFTATLKEKGYDGTIQSKYGDEVVAFYPEQIKSAETVTYDDDGEIIPLSQRFDTTKPDIRFAISDESDIAPEDRTWKDAADRSMTTYGYAHPELQPYYQAAAKAMTEDLTNTVKGERWGIQDRKGYYIGSTGTKRSTTDNIANLLDNAHMTYARISRALEILRKADYGLQNARLADVKKVEMELDTMLQEGYTTPNGVEVPPDEDYIRLLDAIKSGYSSVEEADTAYEEQIRSESYEQQDWEGYDQRADDVYNEVYRASEPEIDSYEDISQEERDYLGEIIADADTIRTERMAREREAAAEELQETELLRQRNLDYAADANKFFEAYNEEELAETDRRMAPMLEEASRIININIDMAPQAAEDHWESIRAQVIEEKNRQLREETVAVGTENDAFLPEGVTDEEIAAAQEKYKEMLAARKEAEQAEYEGLTAEEAEAAQEVKARQAQAEFLEGVDRKNFVGTDSMEKLGIRVDRSTANYRSSKSLIDRAKANAALVKEMDKRIRKMHPSAEELFFARGIINNDLNERSIPAHLDPERVLELADYMMAQKAGRTDLFAAQKADINNRNRQLAEDKFKGAEKAKRIKLLNLNYMTPRRAMIEMFGEEQGLEIYRTFFEPVRTNDAERIRFTERLRQEALEIKGADGKKSKLTKEERAVTQMLMEGKAAGEMIAHMETGGRERIEEAVKKIMKGESIHDKNGVYVVGEESSEELTAKETGIAMRRAAQLKATEALKTGAFDGKKIDGTRVNNAAKYFEKQYDIFYDAINEFLVAHGEQPIGFIKGYAPHIQPEGAMRPLERMLQWMGAPTDITDLRAEIAGETHIRKPNRKWNPHFLSRGFVSETGYDVYAGYEEYIDYVSEVFYHMDDIMRLRAASRYLRSAYTTEDSANLLRQIKDIRNGSYFEKMNFLYANNRIPQGHKLIGSEIDAALDEYVDVILNEDKNKEAVSSSFVMWLDNYTNLLAGKQNAMDRGLEQRAGRTGIRVINRMVNRLISAQVVGNISSALNQMAQLPMTITELGADNVAGALFDMVRHSGEMRRWSTENDFLTARKGTTILNYQISDKLTQVLAKPLEMSDWLMSSLTARAAYRRGIKQGLDAENAMKYSVQKAEDIMGSRNKASKPVAFSTKAPLMRLVNAYQIEVLNQWQHIIKDLPREYKAIANTRGRWAAAGRIAKDLFAYLILAALINRIAEETYGGTPAPLDVLGIMGNFAASGNGLTLNEGIVRVINNMFNREIFKEDHTFDTEMPDEFDWAAAGEDLLYNVPMEIPFLNNVLAVTGLTDDKTVFAAGFNDAIKSFFGKDGALDNFVVTRRERKDGEQEESQVFDGLYDVIMGVSEFLMGGRQIQKSLQGIVAVAGHGEKNAQGNLMYPVESNAGSWIQGTLFGKTALENSRAYYASGASPLKSKRNEQYYGMIDMGINEESAYITVQELADITADKDKNGETVNGSEFKNQMDYVMNTEYSDDVKDFLALSIAGDAAYERYIDKNLEDQGVDPAEFMIGWAYYQYSSKDKAGQTTKFLQQQGVSANAINKIVNALKKK